MSVFKDFSHFVDGESKVPYFVKEAKYVQKPNIISCQFEFEFKTYYKSYHSYYVGIACNSFVRPITAQDFKMVKSLSEKRNKENISTKLQLCFEL